MHHDNLLMCCSYVVLSLTEVAVNIPYTQVGQPLILNCFVTTVRNINSRVDIVWNENNIEIQRTEGINISYIDNNNEAVYEDNYNIIQVNTSDNGKAYQCKVIINQWPPLISTGTNVMIVNGNIMY